LKFQLVNRMDNLPMIAISLIAGFLSTMNIWAVELSDVRLFHLNDVYMVMLMTSWMILLNTLYYHHTNNKLTIAISVLSIGTVLYLIRNQTLVTDTQFMKGMIPHHSMAVTMATKIKRKSKDKNVIALADDIIQSQQKEIAYIKSLGY